MTRQSERDDVVNSVLDLILEITGIDPSAIYPEHTLSDLELTSTQIKVFHSRLSEMFRTPPLSASLQGSNVTLRTIVDVIKRDRVQNAA